MKTVIITTISFFLLNIANGQEKVDLKKVPDNSIGIQTPKSNALILKETQPTKSTQEVDLSEQYNKPVNTTAPATFRTVKQNETQPNMLQSSPEVLNGTTQQINLGTGTKANSTTYYDNEGKIRGTNTTISFDK